MKRLIIGAALAAISLVSNAADQAIVDRYNKSCMVCHAAGVANAPKTASPEAWQPRLAKGMDVLVKSVKTGLNAMPPKGMCMDCSDADYKALIQYMASAPAKK
jgi:cytochrome c5